MPEPPEGEATADRPKAVARRKLALPLPANEPTGIMTRTRSPKTRSPRGPATVTGISRATAPAAAMPEPAPAPPPAHARLHAAPAPSAEVAALATPVWLPIFDGGDKRANRLFRYTLIVSIAIHVLVLAIKFTPIDL